MSERGGLPGTPVKRSGNSQVRHRAHLHPSAGIWRKASWSPPGHLHSFQTVPLIPHLPDGAFESSPATSLFPQESQNLNNK